MSKRSRLILDALEIPSNIEDARRILSRRVKPRVVWMDREQAIKGVGYVYGMAAARWRGVVDPRGARSKTWCLGGLALREDRARLRTVFGPDTDATFVVIDASGEKGRVR